MFALALTLTASLALTTLASWAVVHYVRKEMASARAALARARQDYA